MPQPKQPTATPGRGRTSARGHDLTDCRIVVTAGGTIEHIDPVRVITNLSTGKMGLALAVAALRRGATVTLIASTPDPTLSGLRYVPMSTVASLRDAVLHETRTAHVLIMAAAVSDFRPVSTSPNKIKKTTGRLTLELEPIPDFIHETPSRLFKVGFAAETGDEILTKAKTKFDSHGFDVVCANPIDEPGSGFGTETNRVTILDRSGETVPLPCLPKLEVAHHILDHVRSHAEALAVATTSDQDS